MTPTEALITCPKCTSPACSEVVTEQITYYACFSCGFLSSTVLVKGGMLEHYKEQLPELYKALEWVDPNGLYWYPQSVIMDNKAMVFAEGKSTQDWKWSAVPSQNDRPDMSLKKEFEQNSFIEALTFIGYFDNITNKA